MRYGCNRYEPTVDAAMTPSNAILAAHALPFQRTGEALRAFWPLVVAWVLGLLLGSQGGGQPVQVTGGEGAALVGVILALVIYTSLVAARGAVAWHRMMILGEPVGWTPPVPNGASLRYAAIVLGVGLVFVVVYLIAAAVVVGPLFALFAGPTAAAADAGGDLRLVNVVFQAIAFAIYAGVLALLAGLVLALPSSAVEDPDRPRPDGAARRILVGTALPVAFIISVLSVLAGPVLPTLLAIVLTVLNIYGSLVALTGLSVAYRAARGHMPE